MIRQRLENGVLPPKQMQTCTLDLQLLPFSKRTKIIRKCDETSALVLVAENEYPKNFPELQRMNRGCSKRISPTKVPEQILFHAGVITFRVPEKELEKLPKTPPGASNVWRKVFWIFSFLPLLSPVDPVFEKNKMIRKCDETSALLPVAENE
ncbi:hypothetical protein CEXT_512011 [Caerostris extrusa]|uniref:Uncharacterized protein n=1 Tax=Caerostris extrusa TaxID=172846 RepID=A0AAV4XN76_CAEEX|nr:hypothetical protein CEXT_512011 [Caerostris extrusa]